MINLRNKRWFIAILWCLYIVIILFTVYALRRDMGRLKHLMRDVNERIDKAHTVKVFHPFLVGDFYPNKPFADAIEVMKNSPNDHFWIETNTIDPTINLNYFIYPKEARMSVQTQFELYSFLLDKISYPPKDQPPPSKWDEKVVIHQLVTTTDR